MTNTLQIRGLVLSLIVLGIIGALVGGATVAFYGDVERSTGNTFTAGGVELRVDSVSHYNNMICTEVDNDLYQWQAEAGFVPAAGHYPAPGSGCDGTWAETDLEEGVHKFFNFTDLKPGDEGEDTISLHVYDNPAWGQFLLENVLDSDVTCTDPEQEAEGGACAPGADGEIDNYLAFTAWVDQGSTPGFQCGDLTASSTGAQCDTDPTEGDNVYQDNEGPKFWNGDLISNIGPFDLAPVLAAGYSAFNCTEVNGDTAYDNCHGFAEDGRMVPSVTYYFGMAWDLPLLTTGNDAQTDTYQADMIFRVEQHRNNPTPFAGTTGTTSGTTTAPTATLGVTPLALTATTGQQVNFVASVTADIGFDASSTVVTVSDAAAGGNFFNGTTGGQCNSTTVDADNEFAIGANKGICYQNAVAGVYTVTVTLLDSPGGAVVGTPTDVTVTVTNSTI